MKECKGCGAPTLQSASDCKYCGGYYYAKKENSLSFSIKQKIVIGAMILLTPMILLRISKFKKQPKQYEVD